MFSSMLVHTSYLNLISNMTTFRFFNTFNSVFDCHLLPVGRHNAVKNSVSNDFLIYVSR